MEEKLTYTGLDLIRFAAAISVALYHLSFWWWLRGTEYRPAPVELFRWGWIGVQVFFVLSGFLIAYTAEGRSVRAFAKGRAVRLYPAAWICATITLLAVGRGGLAGWAGSMVLSPIGPWISNVYWTLAVEVAFYALIAVALAMKWKLERVAFGLGLASFAFWLIRAVVGVGLASNLLDGRFGNLTLLPHGCFFALGMALAAKPSRAMNAVIILSIAAGITEIVASRHFYGSGGSALIAPAIWLVALAAIVAAIRWKAPAWLATPAKTAGLMTYPLYLVHKEVGQLIVLRLIVVGPGAALCIALASVLAIAFVVTKAEGLLKPTLCRGRERPVRIDHVRAVGRGQCLPTPRHDERS